MSTSLDPQGLLAAARARTGLCDFGEPDIAEPLEVLCRSFEAEGPRGELVRNAFRGELVSRVSNRLLIVATATAHPEMLARPVERPIIVTGLPRSGTTLLHRLLALDPANRALRPWEMAEPAPPPSPDTEARDPRRRRSRLDQAAFHALCPALRPIHETGADLPEECIGLLANELASIWLMRSFDLPAYRRWLYAQDLTGAYRGHRRQLQLLQWHYATERWVLKAPSHLRGLRALTEVYPDACIVELHRDPLRAVPSAASLFEAMWRPCCPDLARDRLGRQLLEELRDLATRGMAARAALESDARLQVTFVDLAYPSLIADPLAAVHLIYGALGSTVSEELEATMRACLAASPRGRAHHYGLAQYGLTAGEVRATFADYVVRFGIEEEEEAGTGC